MIGLIVLLFLYAVVFGVAEIARKTGCVATITRKFVHIGAGMVSCFLPFLVSWQVAVIIGIFFSFLLFWTKKKGIFDSVHKIKDNDVGAILFPLGLIPCVLVFWDNILIFSSSVLVLGFSDGWACIIGRRYGKRGYSITGYKTLEGSLTFFGVTLAIFLVAAFLSGGGVDLTGVLLVILGSFAVTVVEGLFGRGWDNLFIPICAAFAARLILAR